MSGGGLGRFGGFVWSFHEDRRGPVGRCRLWRVALETRFADTLSDAGTKSWGPERLRRRTSCDWHPRQGTQAAG